MMRVKICGITEPEDARAAAAAGADAVGFVFAPSPRQVSASRAAVAGKALPPFVARVGVFVDPALDFVRETAREAGLHVIQLHGAEDNAFIEAVQGLGYTVVKALAVRDDSVLRSLKRLTADAVLLDTYDPDMAGGTGVTFDWRFAASAQAVLEEADRPLPLILAGGLDADNVAGAVRVSRPYAVDVSSGVERAPGKKCAKKMRRFVENARRQHGNDEAIRGA